MSEAESKMLKITLVKSATGYSKRQKGTVAALGLRRLQYSVLQPDTPAIRGMINKVSHLLKVEEVDGEEINADETA